MAIQNPKKELAVDFNISKIIESIKIIPSVDKKYKLVKSNESFNQYSFIKSGFNSWGEYIDISLTSINTEKTNIEILIRKKVGSYHSHDINSAYNTLDYFLEIMADICSGKDIKKAYVNNSKKSIFKKWWFWVAAVIVISIIANSNNDNVEHLSNTNDEVIISEKKTSEEILLSHLSAWDGSLNPLVKVIKDDMNDPDSFEHVRTTYMQTPGDSTDFLITMDYRGKNAFGALVKNSVKCIYNVNKKEIRNIK